MAELAAPYFSPADLSQAPNPLLGGNAEFDPNTKGPLEGFQNTISQINAANNAEQQQKREQIFQRQQQQERFKNDALARAQEYGHQDAVMKYKQGQENTANLYKMFASGQHSAFDKSGVAMIPLPGDDKVLIQSAHDIRKELTADPSNKWADPDFQDKADMHQKMTALAGVRAAKVTELKQMLAQTSDPEEQKNLKASIDDITNTPLSAMQIPEAHLPTPAVTEIIEPYTKAYKNDAGAQSFTTDDGDMIGRPNIDYDAITYATPGSDTYRKAYNAFAAFQRDPAAKDPNAFLDFEQKVNGMRKIRGQKALNLGQVTPEGRVVLGDPMAVATGMQLTHDGALKEDPDYDPAAEKLKSAQAEEATAKAKAAKEGKSYKPSKEELVENRDKKEVVSMYKEVKKSFEDATSKEPLNLAYPEYWKNRGVDPTEYKIFPEISKDSPARRYIGIEEDPTSETITSSADKTTTKTIAGESQRPDRIFPIQNKKTGERELVYMKDNQVVAKVPQKQAIINGIKHDAKYKPSDYSDKTVYVDEIYENGDKPEEVKVSEKESQKTPVAAHLRKQIKGVTYEKGSDGLWRKI